MIRTHALKNTTNITLGFMLAMIVAFMFATTASAKGGKDDNQGEQNFRMRDSKSGSSENRIGSLEDRLKNIEEMRAKLQDLLSQLKSGSTTISSSTRDRREDRREDRKDRCAVGTSTVATTTVQTGSSTDMHKHKQKGKRDKCLTADKKLRGNERLQVQNPNGGSRVVNDTKEGILIRWKAPRDMATVDISFTKEGASSTNATSIATGVDAHNKAKSAKSGNRSNGSYLWKGAQVGTGYKIVVTGVNGTTTLTDSSDKTFSIVASKSDDDDEDES
jgi:hypothetical protein